MTICLLLNILSNIDVIPIESLKISSFDEMVFFMIVYFVTKKPEQKSQKKWFIINCNPKGNQKTLSIIIYFSIKSRIVSYYPNPFNPSITIDFSIPFSDNVNISVLDIVCKEVDVLRNEYLTNGNYIIEWSGQGHPSGIYFISFRCGGFVETQKVFLMKWKNSIHYYLYYFWFLLYI